MMLYISRVDYSIMHFKGICAMYYLLKRAFKFEFTQENNDL